MQMLYHENDPFDFNKPVNNRLRAVEAYSLWGLFDPGKSDYRDGDQCPPVNRGINTPRKKVLFALPKEVTGT